MPSDRRRVFAPQALGADEYLRATWHEGKRVVVFSQWSGAECVAAMPVRVNELGELASLLVEALGRSAAGNAAGNTAAWAPPNRASRIAEGPQVHAVG